MALRIANNVAALNAQKWLSTSTTGLSRSLERLSSGYRINKAADDAAGLAVSSSFRADLASYRVANRNTTEASALLQVAEGAADQIGNMLTRLKELATQAASANSGQNIQRIDDENAQILLEIERIAGSTEYAQTKLIDGSYGITVSSTATNGAGVATANGFVSMSGMKAKYTYNIDVTDTNGSKADITLTVYDTAGALVGSQAVADTSIPGTGSTATVSFGAYGVDLVIDANVSELMSSTEGRVDTSHSGSDTFQVGSENATNNQLSISLGDLTQSGLGISTVDMSTATNAQKAIDSIDAAISTLSEKRGDIGAYMNRLSYAAANLTSTMENVTAAESVIRDVDMAAEMSTFTKNQILMQAGTAMLAQANMMPQAVLSLIG